MSRKLIALLAVLGYGCPPHPAIYRDADGTWRCTECHNPV